MTDSEFMCTFTGCTNASRSIAGRGLCNAHQMQRSRGQELKPLRVRNQNGPTCVFPGCSKDRYGADHCVGHRMQLQSGRPLSPLKQYNRIANGCKKCTTCSTVKPVEMFHARKFNHVAAMCMDCVRIDHRVRAYGISWDEAVALQLVATCASCGSDVDPSGRDHHVDHCHETGAIRGVLCHGCNTALGLLGEDSERIRALAEYIERHRVAVA